MIDIVIATRNPNKFRELKALLAAPGVRWRDVEEFLHVPRVRETGKTFLENAVNKARVMARATGCWAIADDSGLEVDALRGAPGVRSARFAGRIAMQSAGSHGFGYDPIFYLPRRRMTSAQLAPSLKNRLSHRGQAVRRMRRILARLARSQ